jgi:hypothetical protein
MMKTELAALQRDRETSVQPLSRHSRTKTTFEDRPQIPHKTLIHIISSIFFRLYREENGIGDRSEEHLKNPKITRDTYLGLVYHFILKIAQSILGPRS